MRSKFPQSPVGFTEASVSRAAVYRCVTLHVCCECVEVLFCFVGCFTSQQHARVSQGRICSHKCTCCHTEIEVADPTFYLTQSQYTDTGPTSPSADPITPGAWQGSHWSAILLSHWDDSTRKNPVASENGTPDLPLPRWRP